MRDREAINGAPAVELLRAAKTAALWMTGGAVSPVEDDEFVLSAQPPTHDFSGG